MQTITNSRLITFRGIRPFLFLIALILLIGSWTLLYEFEIMFTESNLVGYYCCVTEAELPQLGTVERTISDFFNSPIGKNLLSTVFIGANLILFVASIRYLGKENYWWIPFLFLAFGIYYLAADLAFSTSGWVISDWVNGPRTTVYKGYGRTIYGTVLHLILWVGYFTILAKTIRTLKKSPNDEANNGRKKVV